jgi:hypothetical protein
MNTESDEGMHTAGPVEREVGPHPLSSGTRSRSQLAQEVDCWTADELMAFTGCTAATLENWRKRGKGPAYILAGNNYLYQRSAVVRWLKDKNSSPSIRAFTTKDLL